jgi:hypothetical protein
MQEDIKLLRTGQESQCSGVWYKFNDEYVTPADRREAIRNNFGIENIHEVNSCSSAYMLVYIRQTEAAEVSWLQKHHSLFCLN